MHGEFLLRASTGERSFRLVWLNRDHARGVLDTPNLHAEWTVYLPDFGPALVDFLQQSAQLGRRETAQWESIEGEVRITAEHDGLGHVAFSVALMDSAESVSVNLIVELGQLPGLVDSAHKFIDRN